MRSLLIILASLAMCACGPIDYCWQDQYQLNREDFSADLAHCKDYAARQYRPGIPAGTPYRAEDAGYPHGQDTIGTEITAGEWRPDRNPMRWISISTPNRHEVDTAYTGYPGALDYAPNYTDDILEKCMSDRGWAYLPVQTER
ncbi:MAG: hypothetical protein RQ723_07350 [Desulfuromonadales bacterium]|nr:hypothetical protein [Desulfuromonadales bacterium]